MKLPGPHSAMAALVCVAAMAFNVASAELTNTNVVVAAISDAHWTQGAPYNDYSPRGTLSYTNGWEAGCVAIAAAQELRHWQWPWRLEAVRETYHPVLGESDLAIRFDGNAPFDWDAMPASCGSGATLAQKHACARLVLACQSLVQMQFVANGGEAKKNLPGTMEWYEYAGQVTPRASEANLAALRADFEFGSPVQTGIDFKGYDGHEVVGLGYATGTDGHGEAKNLIWLNFGWGGGSDGWYDLGETNKGETIVKSVQLGFRPIKSVQIEPIAPVSGPDVTLKWHLPNCYTNKVSCFTVATKRLSAATTDWTDDFSTGGKGRSSNTNEMRVAKGGLMAWQGTASAVYTYDETFVPTEDSTLTYDLGSGYMYSMSARFEARANGGPWMTLHNLALEGGSSNFYKYGGRDADMDKGSVPLDALAGKRVQLRIVVEYTKGGVSYNTDCNMRLDNLVVSNVKTFDAVVASSTKSATERTAALSGLETGETYAFSVAPIMSDGAASVTQTVTTVIGTPAASPTIGAVTMTPKGADLVQEGFYADIAMGWNVIDVACENVATLEAFPSHQSVLPQSKVEVVDKGNGSYSIFVDATEVATKWAGQRMILTLKSTNSTGESVYKDLELRLVASGVPENVPAGKNRVFAAGGEGDVVAQSGATLVIVLSDAQVAYGYSANTITIASGATLRFEDESGNTIAHTVSGTTYSVAGKAKTWAGMWDYFSDSTCWTGGTPVDGDYVIFNDELGGVYMTLDRTSDLDLKSILVDGVSKLTIDDGGSGTITADALSNSIALEINTAKLQPKELQLGAALTIGNGGYLASLVEYSQYLRTSDLQSSSKWGGTVWFKGTSLGASTGLANYGNSHSLIRMTGCTGYFPRNTTLTPIELTDDGSAPALHLNNGFGDTTTTFTKLSGSGTLKTSASGAAEFIIVNDVSEFAGSIDLATKTVTIGKSNPSQRQSNGRLRLESGMSATIAGGKTWKASGGVYLGGSQALQVNGTLTTTGALSVDAAGVVLSIAPTGRVSAANMTLTNATLRLAFAEGSSPAVSVSGAANLSNTTIEVSLATGMAAASSIALVSAGSFAGVDTATLSGLDEGYSLEVIDGALYAKRETVPAEIPGTISDEPLSQSNVVLDDAGEWAVIGDKPIFFTAHSQTNVFTVAFVAYVPEFTGSLFGFASRNASGNVAETRVRRKSGGIVVGAHSGTTEMGSGKFTGGTTVLAPGEHTVMVEYDHRNTLQPPAIRGTTIYIDGTNVYHSKDLSWKDRTTILFSIGGEAVTNAPTDVLSGLKVKNLTFMGGMFKNQSTGEDSYATLNGKSVETAESNIELARIFGLCVDSKEVVFAVGSVGVGGDGVSIVPTIRPDVANGIVTVQGRPEIGGEAAWQDLKTLTASEIGEGFTLDAATRGECRFFRLKAASRP